MHTYQHRHLSIHYSPDLSGEVIITDQEQQASVSITGPMLKDFMQKLGYMHKDDLVDGWVVKEIDESKLPLFRFDCGRHAPWEERKHLAQGVSYCKECDKEHDEYNDMLKEKGFNWPPACPRSTSGRLIDKGGDYETTRPATIQEVLDGRAVRA